MGLRNVLQSVFGTSPDTLYHECRSCGKAVRPERSKCPFCGKGIASYRL